MSSTLKHLRIHCNRWLIYSNELEFAFYLSHKNHCYCWADRWSVLNRLQFIRRKEEHYTPHIWRTCLALFLQLQKLFSFYFFQWDSLSFFFFCSVSSSLLLWSLLEINRNFNLNARSFHTSYSFNNISFFFCISSVKGSKVSFLHNEDNLKMVQF